MTADRDATLSDLAPSAQRPSAQERAVLDGRHVTMVEGTRVVAGPSADEVARALAGDEFVWVDVHEPGDGDVQALAEMLGLHPLAVEDTSAFGQRPKVDTYDGHALMVLYGAAADEEGLVEVHCIVGATYLVTLHRDDCLAFPLLHRRLSGGAGAAERGMLLYRVADALTDSFFPVMERGDDRIDTLQSEIFISPRDEHIREVFAMKQALIGLRRVIAPQRDLFASVAAGSVDLPGVDEAQRHYFRDVYDHLIRLSEMVDTHRDLLSGVIEVHLAMVANRRDQVMKQLTLIATIFMPLTFITGFFGQNFGWMVDQVGSWWAFAAATLLQLVALVVAITFFRRRGWA